MAKATTKLSKAKARELTLLREALKAAERSIGEQLGGQGIELPAGVYRVSTAVSLDATLTQGDPGTSTRWAVSDGDMLELLLDAMPGEDTDGALAIIAKRRRHWFKGGKAKRAWADRSKAIREAINGFRSKRGWRTTSPAAAPTKRVCAVEITTPLMSEHTPPEADA